MIILFYEAHPVGGKLIPGDDASDAGVFKQHELPTNIAFDLHRQIIHRWFKQTAEHSVGSRKAIKD